MNADNTMELYLRKVNIKKKKNFRIDITLNERVKRKSEKMGVHYQQLYR